MIGYVFHSGYSLCELPRLDGNLKTQVLMDKTTFQLTLSMSLNVSNFHTKLLTVPKIRKDFIHQYKCKKENFDLEERLTSTDIKLPTKHFFSSNFVLDIFLFVAAIISVLVTLLAIYLLCKHIKLKMLVTSLALQQIKEVGAVTIWEDVTINTCKIQLYNFGIKYFNIRPSALCSSIF